MANESLIVGNSNWAVKANNLLGYAVGETSGYYVPRELNFTRNSTATYTDENGIIQTAAANIARVQDNALLLEPQRTNLLTYSEQFDNAAYILDGNGVGQSVTDNYAISPDGTQNADRLQLNKTGGTYSRIYQNASSGANTYALTVYMKSNTSASQNVGLRLDTTGINCVVTTSWQRFTLNATVSTPQAQILLFDSITGNDETADISVWGFQLEAGSYATSYINTLSAAVTRGQDVCSKTGISSLIGQTEGVLFIDINITKLTDNEAIGTINSGGYASNTTFQRLGNTIQFVRNSATQSGASVETQIIAIGRHKMAIAYKSGDTAFYLDGSQVSTTQTQTFTNGTLSVLNLGTDAIGALPITESYNEVILFPTRLTNSEIAIMTGNQNYTINLAYAAYGVASESPNCVQP